MNVPSTKVDMGNPRKRRAAVLCLSGLDPGGGAGIQADIEAIAAAGAHALPIITVNTVQSTTDVFFLESVSISLILRQLQVLAADCSIDAVKIGLSGSAETVEAVADWLASCAAPVVCDPVLRAGGGADLASSGLIAALRSRLFPKVTLLTPNAAEARRLVPAAASLREAGRALLTDGCANVLITGGDEPGEQVVNTWHRPGAEPLDFVWPRLPEKFHGAGCTLASAIAARLAQGCDMHRALSEGQSWTQAALARAWRPGCGRAIAGRIEIAQR